MMVITKIWTFLADEDGPTAVEYAVLVMLVFLVVIGTIQTLGTSLNASFANSSTIQRRVRKPDRPSNIEVDP